MNALWKQHPCTNLILGESKKYYLNHKNNCQIKEDPGYGGFGGTEAEKPSVHHGCVVCQGALCNPAAVLPEAPNTLCNLCLTACCLSAQVRGGFDQKLAKNNKTAAFNIWNRAELEGILGNTLWTETNERENQSEG